MSGATFQSEVPSIVLIDEASALFLRHFDEIAAHKELFGAPAPHRERYANMIKAGVLRVVTARDEARALVGYFVFVVQQNAHYQHIISATEDLYFLAPEYRRGFDGAAFLDFAVEQMRASGAHYGSLRSKMGHEYEVMMELLGFRKIEIVWQQVFRHG